MKTLKLLILSLATLLVTVGASNKAPQYIPAKPGAVSPANGGLTTDYTPTLKWTNTGTTYDIEIATDPSFGAYIIDSNTGFAGNTYTLGVILDPAKTYYWHVKAYDGTGNSGWSNTFTFRTAVEPPTLTDPADSSTLQNNRPTFKWTTVLNATGYNLQVSQTSLFSTVILNVTLPYTSTEYTPAADLTANATLYWRVRTLNGTYGPSDWSPGPIGNYFTITKTALQPTAPTPVYPGNGKLTDDYTPRLTWTASSIPSATTFDYYEVQITTDSTFTDMDPVSIICLPPTCIDDTSVTTRVTDITSGTASFDVPDPGSELDPATTFYWRVRAYNHLGGDTFYSNWSNVFTLNTTYEPLTLNTPANFSSLTFNQPQFSWTDPNVMPHGGYYYIQVSKNPGFTDLIINKTSPNPFKPGIPLPSNRTLYWRVRITSGTYGPSRWSEVWQFDTANPPGMPVLKSPISNALVTNDTPTFKWSVSTLPLTTTFSNYTIEVSTGTAVNPDGSFVTTVINDSSATNQYDPQFTPGAPLTTATKYYWHVEACNTDGECSNWSPTAAFRIAIESPTLVTYGGGSLTNIPPFDWNDIPGASGYAIQVWKDGAPGTLLINTTVASSQFSGGSGLPAGTYFWRVRTNSPYFGPSVWSAVDSFQRP